MLQALGTKSKVSGPINVGQCALDNQFDCVQIWELRFGKNESYQPTSLARTSLASSKI